MLADPSKWADRAPGREREGGEGGVSASESSLLAVSAALEHVRAFTDLSSDPERFRLDQSAPDEILPAQTLGEPAKWADWADSTSHAPKGRGGVGKGG